MVGYPELVYNYPVNGSTSISVNTDFTLDWSIDISLSQVTDANELAKRFVLFDEETNAVIALTYVSYEASDKRLTLRPASVLRSSTKYRLIVRSGFQDANGRKTRQDYTISFTTASIGLTAVSLLSPTNGSSLLESPYVFTWNPTTSTTGVVGLAYDVNFYENGINIGTFTSVGTELVLADGSYEATLGSLQGRTLSWEVVTRTNFGYSSGTVYYTAPSARWSILFDTGSQISTPADPSSSRVYDFEEYSYPVPLVVDSVTPEHLSTNQVAFPVISLTFTQPIVTGGLNSYFSVVRKDQLPRNDIPASYLESTVSGSWSVDGTVATFTPSETFYSNMRYTVSVRKGLSSYNGSQTLGENFSYQFSSLYDPYYVDIRVIKARLRSEASTMPDDLINYYIYLASLEAKAKFSAWILGGSVGTFGDSLLETYVRDTNNLKGFGVLKWVEAYTLVQLYASILVDELRNVGRRRRLGDYEEALTDDFLAGIKDAKQAAADEMIKWEVYLTPSGHIGYATRMSDVNLDMTNYFDVSLDWGEINRGRNF